MSLRPLTFALLAGLAGLAALAPAPGRADAPAGPAGPALAVEDTLHTEVPPVLVHAPRVTLDEILDRVARGEARRDSLVLDETFVVTVRVVGHTQQGGTPKLLEERVTQVWRKQPDRRRTVELRHWRAKPPKGDDDDEKGVRVEMRGGTEENIVNFAFQPRSRRDFRYRIEGRELRGDHLVYRIAFEPASPLDVARPGGVVWVDTKDYVIVRQEVTFRQSPVPLFLKGIRRMVVERTRVGDVWVLSRILARIETTIPLPEVGRGFDFGITMSDYAINTGLPDSLFVVAKRGGGR